MKYCKKLTIERKRVPTISPISKARYVKWLKLSLWRQLRSTPLE
jgi:hypothetical protein